MDAVELPTMSHIRIAPGAWYGHRKAVCDDCGWSGPSHGQRGLAVADGEMHACDPSALARMQALAESVREYAVPTEG